MAFYLAKTPKLLQKLLPFLTWKVKTEKNQVFLTFDDGPHPEITPWVLSVLRKYNAKATFFCVGENIKKYPDIFKMILNEGHTIGNHTFNHVQGWKVSNNYYLNNIALFEKEISKHISEKQIKSKLFRPPHGKIKPSQSKQLIKNGHKVIMWDVLSADYDKNVGKEKCLMNVLNNTEKGSIIVFHDSEKAQKNLEFTLPKAMHELSKKGLSFSALN